ncbi:hypothetical protein [Photobacterium sp. TY1-4]|uniref:hypothetical protein n=1 Tax=Photobacterium sp. TY1-4 TaxID=2899122 RepID=UPI0021BFBABC|nr:hypothetical protein [Photobacterium sp. TY1-4]UXI01343.1 hypothetical protein NH461_00255 [Photobacterium sp. TY1-4]
MKKMSLLAVSVALALTGCGGGSESGSGSGDEKKPHITEPAAGDVVITTMDGYLKNALICSDTNQNGLCEANEVITDIDGKLVLTDAEGKLDIKVKKSIEESIQSNPLVVKILEPYKTYPEFGIAPGIYTVDMDQPDQAMGKDVVFRAPAGSPIASPITDLIVAEMKQGKDQAAAENQVRLMLSGLKEANSQIEINLYADYVKEKTAAASEEAKLLASKLHKTAQILTETQHQTATDVSLDKVAEQVVAQTVDAVNSATTEQLDNPNYKPVVPVTKIDGEEKVEPAVANYQATVNATVLKQLSQDLAGAELKSGQNFNYTAGTAAYDLFNDEDQATAPDVSITPESSQHLADNGIDVSIDHNGNITIRAIEDTESSQSKAQAGIYYLALTAQDLDAQSNQVGVATTLIPFEVAVFNTKPVVHADKLATLQDEVNQLALQEGQTVSGLSLDMSDLFTDEDGDVLNYSVVDGNTGLSYDVQYPMITISGTPRVPGDFSITITAQDDDNNQESAKLQLSIEKKPATSNSLSDLLVDRHLYRFNADRETQKTIKPSCWALRLTPDHKILEADSVNGECPAEDSLQQQTGTWALDGDNLTIQFDGKTPETLKLVEDRSNEPEMPRLHLLSVTQQATITKAAAGMMLESETKTSSLTFYIGKASADQYWQQPTATAMVNNKLTQADAFTRVQPQNESDSLDGNLYLNTSCESLGFIADNSTDPDGNPGYQFGDSMVYDFYLLNDKFEQGFHSLAQQSQSNQRQSLAFGRRESTECMIDFDYAGTASFKPGESVVALASPTGISVSEEVMLNTYIDRNDSITPKASLNIDESGLYTVHIDDGEGIVTHMYRDTQGIIQQQEWFYSPNTGWGAPIQMTVAFTPYQINENTLYQVWVEGEGSGPDDSYTIWTDNGTVLLLVDAGVEVGDDPLCPEGNTSEGCAFSASIHDSESAAKAQVESLFNQQVNFTDTTWTAHYGDDESETLHYAETGVTIDGTLYTWGEIPRDLPCLVDNGHTCSVTELNQTYNFCDADEPTDWAECSNNDKYEITWKYNPVDGVLHREKRAVEGNHTSYSYSVQQ